MVQCIAWVGDPRAPETSVQCFNLGVVDGLFCLFHANPVAENTEAAKPAKWRGCQKTGCKLQAVDGFFCEGHR